MTTAFQPLPVEPYKLWDIDSIFELEAPEWLIENVIPKGGSTLLYGPTNVGKSLVTLDWAFRLASGWSWMGKEVKESSVLYVYAEGGHDLQLRYQAWVEGYGHTQPHKLSDNLHFIGLDEEIHLRWSPDAEEPPEGVRRLYATVDPTVEGQRQYDVIIFDPAQEVWRGMNDNEAQSVAMAWRVVKDLQRMHDAAAVIVHHARKDGDTFRGATTWLDLADTGFAVTDEDHGLVAVTNTKNRYAEKGHGFLLRRNAINIDKVPKLFGQSSVYLSVGHRASQGGEAPEVRFTLEFLQQGPQSVAAIVRGLKDEFGQAAETTTRRMIEAMAEQGLIEQTGNRGPWRLVADKAKEVEDV